MAPRTLQPLDIHLAIIDYVKQEKSTTTVAIADHLKRRKLKSVANGNVFPTLISSLCAIRILSREKGSGHKPGTVVPAEEARRAVSMLKKLDSAGVLRIPWGTFGDKRRVYIERLCDALDHRPPPPAKKKGRGDVLAVPSTVVAKPMPSVAGISPFFTPDGGLPEGHVLMMKVRGDTQVFALGRPRDLNELHGGGN